MKQLEIDQDRLDSPTPQSLDLESKWSITNLTVSIPSSSASSGSTSTSSSSSTIGSRWRTKEFYIYYLVFLVVVPQMVWSPIKISSNKNPLYWTYQHRLNSGWIFGWKDNSDHQYHLFRSNFPLLSTLFIVFLSLSHLSRSRLFKQQQQQPPSKHSRSNFILSFSLLMLSVMHGTSLLKMVGILWVNWKIARFVLNDNSNRGGGGFIKREWVPYLTWGFNVVVLFANEIYGGYEFGKVFKFLGWLDEYKGLLPRWQIMWNISMLRIISFNMELYWSTTTTTTTTTTSSSSKHLPPPPRTDSSGNDNYSFKLFLSYVLYPPLYLAGPIISYPSFLSQLSSSPSPPPPPPPPSQSSSNSISNETRETSLSSILRYSFRFLSSLLTMELILHTMYVVAIKDSGVEWWGNLNPLQVSMVGFWNLIIVWLKLLIPWRFFRLVALIDGIDPPENMVRCMANNYSTLGFWRSWHRSYNLWIIRYLYIPIGGSKRPLVATLVVFTFVALWHDLSLKLLVWGWGISLFVLPEMICTHILPYKKFGDRIWYRHLAAFGGVFNILLMMTANLVGFVVGIDGAKALWFKMLGTTEGRVFMIVASACLFVAVQIMFEYREEERRRGINRRC
ncbi:hypothetical protein JCM5350_005309 [Sporobolomyces pararoseus]